ncbi:C40 family peptidase [Streptomyces sp. NPDC048270]|uniref:C40 family peptidase n=1 Tax=Streptomyces sp. NPDC048270 TaxID=3154615 RepID=UPI0033F03968
MSASVDSTPSGSVRPPAAGSGKKTHGTGGASQAPAQAVAYARAQLGRAYRMGGIGPESFDCSGLVLSAYRSAGVSLPRTSQAQSRLHPAADLETGDVLYWGVPGAATHVALYVGGGKFIGAQNSRTGVVERSVEGSGYTGAVRVSS